MTAAELSQIHAAWFQGWAAWAQAILTALAVLVAWWLQKRLLDERDTSRRSRQLEGVASSAMWILRLHRRMVSRAQDGIQALRFSEIAREEEIDQGMRVLHAFEISALEDENLSISFLALRMAFQRAAEAIGHERDRIQRLNDQSAAINAHHMLDGYTTDIFNAASSVERRVAQLNGRLARESQLSTALTKSMRENEPLTG